MYNEYVIKLATPFPPIAVVFYAGNLHMCVKKHVTGHVQRMAVGNLAYKTNLRCKIQSGSFILRFFTAA